jgi:hypothetical protein
MAGGPMTKSLQRQYELLLEQRGLDHLVARPAPDDTLRLIEEMTPHERTLFADIIQSIRDGDYSIGDEGKFDAISADIQATIERSGIPLPGSPVYVGEYPHNSFNAQACAVTGGTLILINRGLVTLVHEIAKCWGLSLLSFDRSEDGGILPEQPTAETTRQRDEARVIIARAVLAYIFQNDARLGGRIPIGSRAAMGFHLTRATEKFVIGHEFGHLLAGHLDEPRAQTAWGELIRKTHAQEFEADEIGGLLMLRDLDPSDQIQTNLAIAGPFFFFAIDHLVTRVRNEVNDIPAALVVTDHPPSDERAAALRRLFLDNAGLGALQFANAIVSWLSTQEDEILSVADDFVHS